MTPCFDFQVVTSWIQPFQGLIVIVWLLSHVRLFATPRTATCQASLSFTIYQSLLKLMSIELMMPSNHLILCCSLLLLPSILPSIRVFSNELTLHIRWPKYWNFSFSVSPSSEYSGLISFRTDWFDFLVVQGTLKSLLQHHCLKASAPSLQHLAFFMVQLSHLYMTWRGWGKVNKYRCQRWSKTEVWDLEQYTVLFICLFKENKKSLKWPRDCWQQCWLKVCVTGHIQVRG